MEYCGERGIPHSRFLSWSEDDQDLALAWLIEKNSKCPRCGTYQEEWIDEEGKSLEPMPYSVEVDRCYGCLAVDEAMDHVPQDQRMSVSTRFVKNRVSIE